MKPVKKADILGCMVDIVTQDQALDQIAGYIAAGTPSHVITLNAEIVYEARNNKELKDIINRADLVTPDGIGIVWGGNRLGYKITERVTGIDLLYCLCEEAALKEWNVYLLGSAPGIAQSASIALQKSYPGLKVCGTHDGYFQEENIRGLIEEIKGLQPQILFVALGAPKQEVFIQTYKNDIGAPVCIGVGGSFDVIAGNKKRAPKWIIALNLEWLYRLIVEPSRFKRQLVLPKFVITILKEKQHQKQVG